MRHGWFCAQVTGLVNEWWRRQLQRSHEVSSGCGNTTHKPTHNVIHNKLSDTNRTDYDYLQTYTAFSESEFKRSWGLVVSFQFRVLVFSGKEVQDIVPQLNELCTHTHTYTHTSVAHLPESLLMDRRRMPGGNKWGGRRTEKWVWGKHRERVTLVENHYNELI